MFPFASPSCWAKDYHGDPEYDTLYQQFITLNSQQQTDTTFYIVAENLGEYYKNHDDLRRYYSTQLNICLYDIEHNMPYKAVKRANEMLEEMEAGHTEAYEYVYIALANVYESRGNQRIARYYYEKAISTTDPKETTSTMNIELRMANLLAFANPEEAKKWNEKANQPDIIPSYKQAYYVIEGIIAYVMNDKQLFEETYKSYKEHHEQHPTIDNYGAVVLEIIDLAFQGKYEEALALLPNSSYDLNDVARYDMAILIYERMGKLDQALQSHRQRADLVDSLNSEILFNNMDEISAQVGVNKAMAEVSNARERTTRVFTILSIAIIITLILLVRNSRKNKKMLTEKNEQLHSALSMAEEGEKMKLEFVRSVSHEIRTPLNAINGFNDILNTPGIEISAEERRNLTDRINENVRAITNIVDEMLHVADKESNEFYPKLNTIHPNQFFSALLYEHRNKVKGAIELNYTTRVINRFEIVTNKDGLQKIMEQLIQNAIKFTSKGSITVHCELVDDDRQLQVSVTDTGRGISKEQRDKIFEGFYKADAFDQGIGLGLTVSKKIANKLGGDLILDESYDKGARFILALPV
jgi:signal transduction histidine kinase